MDTTKEVKNVKTENNQKLWRDVCYSFWQSRFDASLKRDSEFNWNGEFLPFKHMGLRDRSFYVCRENFLRLYPTLKIPKKGKDEDGYIGYQKMLIYWCGKKAEEIGRTSDDWILIREKIKIRARKVIEVLGEDYIICKPEHVNKILDKTLFILYCEKEDSGKEIQEELWNRGYKCKMVLSEGIAKGVEQFLLIEILEKILNQDEAFQVISIHDDDVGGAKIYNVLMKYIPNLLDGGINKEFWEFHNGTYEYDDYSEPYDCNPKDLTSIQDREYSNLTHINKRVELPIFILREGASPIVDFLESKIINFREYDLNRINISESDDPKNIPFRLDQIYDDLNKFKKSIYPETKKEKKIRNIRNRIRLSFENIKKEIRQNFESKMENLENAFESYDNEFWQTKYYLEREKEQKQDNIIKFWKDENKDKLLTNWKKDADVLKTCFQKYHAHFTGHLLKIDSEISNQNALLERTVDDSLKNRKILDDLEENSTNHIEFMRFLKIIQVIFWG